MAKRSAVEQIVIEEKTVSDAVLKLISSKEKGEKPVHVASKPSNTICLNAAGINVLPGNVKICTS